MRFPPHLFDCFSLVLHLTRVSVTAGSMGQYLGTAEVAQAVQLLLDGGWLLPEGVSQHRLKIMEESPSRRTGQGPKSFSTHQQDRYLTFVQGGAE